MRARRSVLALCLFAAACSDAEPVGIHLKLAADGTGLLTCRSLQLVSTTGPMEGGSQGVVWNERAQLFASRGAVAKVGELRLQDMAVESPSKTSLRLSFPRGAEAKWHTLLAPPAEGRAAAATALDPARPAAAIGETIRIEIETPGEVTAVGHAPTARMVKSDKDGKRALLWIPVATARSAGETIVFDITWR